MGAALEVVESASGGRGLAPQGAREAAAGEPPRQSRGISLVRFGPLYGLTSGIAVSPFRADIVAKVS